MLCRALLSGKIHLEGRWKKLTTQEKANIIALARLVGITDKSEDILNRYEQLYKEAFASLSSATASAKVEVFKRPF